MNQSIKTQTVGELLAKKRLEKKLSLSDIAKTTQIKLPYLEALEANDFASLPSAPYIKAYVTTYAKLLGLNSSPLLAILRRDYQESAKGRLVPREFIRQTLKKSALFSPVRLALLSALTLFVVFFAYAFWQWFQLSRPPRLEVFQPTEWQNTAAKVIVEGQTVDDALVMVNAQPVALQTGGFFSSEVYFTVEGPAIITIKATDKRGKTTTVQRQIQVKF